MKGDTFQAESIGRLELSGKRNKMKKMNFRDQVDLLQSWFKDWSECEQTVALYTLLKRVNPSQARFLDLVLEQALAESEEYHQLAREANNPGKVSVSFALLVVVTVSN